VALIIDVNALRSGGGRSKIFEGHEHDGVGVAFFLVDVDPGDGPALHAHPYEEVFVILEGRATFRVGDETVDVSSGHVVIGPAEVPHAFVCAGPERLRTVNIHPRSRMETTWLEG
jgi:mannose-6-phosphate isomerase-like protein (cupin superfamily)